jgi:hypothetical protein
MIETLAEKTISRYLIFGVPLASAFIWASGTTDPVNVTKLFIAGGVGAAAGIPAIAFLWKRTWANFRVQIIAILLFQLAMLNALIRGQGPFLQSYYGAYGRQNGYVTYLSLSLILFSALALQAKIFYQNLIKGIIFVGILNIFYCAWVLLFGDFLPWNNVYRSILGLFGNPDFISAFLGIFIVVCGSLFLDPKSSPRVKAFLAVSSAIAFFEIIKSHAIQGIVVTFGGITLIGFFWLRSKSKTWVLPGIYALGSLLAGLLAILGTLQVGPLSFIYKRSVSLRGSYWRAGLGMGNKFPTSGVGLDGYGDFYRQTRPPVALIDTPGVQVVSNVSHNVFIDFFASGGWPLLITYALLNILVIVEIVRQVVRFRQYDPIFVALSSAWLCYTVQSIISINQIGLAIWGWVLAGAILSYTHGKRNIEAGSVSAKLLRKNQGAKIATWGTVFSPQLIAGIGLVLGLMMCFPPLGSDLRWRSALDSRNLAIIEKSLSESFFNPVPPSRFVMAYQLFGNSNLPDKAYKYAKIITKSDPNYFEGWKALYLLPRSTSAEKQLAAENLKRLDPLNPDVLSPTP